MADTDALELVTREMRAVEILKEGVWNGKPYTSEDLDNIVAAFGALKGIHDPPAKLGHDPNQKFAQKSGLPAVGWVSRLTRAGKSLFADFTDVPAQFAELVEAGGYKKRSAEIWRDIEFNGTTYPLVLKAVSWLGADVPAVSGMSDMVELYEDDDVRATTEFATVDVEELMDMSHKEVRNYVHKALEREFPYPNYDDMGGMSYPEGATGESPSCYICEMFDDYVVVYSYDYSSLYKIPFTFSDMEVTLGEPARVMIAYEEYSMEGDKTTAETDELDSDEPEPEATTEETSPDGLSEEEEADVALESELRGILELGEDADVRQAVTELRATQVNPTEHEQLQAEVEQLRHRADERDATELVELAMTDGKVVPAQREWATSYAARDREGFATFVKNAPKVIHLDSETGVDAADGDTPPEEELDVATAEMGKEFGISAERLADQRPLAIRLEESRKPEVVTS